ncbi:MAG: phosphoribosylglycinamide formyltransferase [Gammaproteobacteria bacterium]|nr:phosphoribosylglycinamide formyltransferase [Gammaproteobacteria bacterium]|tara:strand:+ start:6284 stop:6919 length:636 start_codon:yes stop_codon:yes gene_type:complete
MISINILFSNRGSNAISILNKINESKLNLKLNSIICNNKKASGIPDIKNLGFNVNIIDSSDFNNTTDYNNKLLNVLLSNKSEYLLLCGYMKVIPKEIIKAYDLKILNIHPSLLPNYKGLNTHTKVIQNKDLYHGCSVHFVNEHMDSGPIVAQSRIKVIHGEDPDTLANRLLPIEHNLYFNVLKLIQNKEILLKNKIIYYKGEILDKPINFQ